MQHNNLPARSGIPNRPRRRRLPLIPHPARITTHLVAVVFLVAALFPGWASAPVAVAQDQPAQASRAWITPKSGKPFFVIAANYEGPTDRAWKMWDNDKFDPSLIAEDFSRARSLGINTLRIFVQSSLREDMNVGDFSKLDAVTALARQYDLKLILTFTDWAEPDLQKAAGLNARIASQLVKEPSILAYDIKNEPQWNDIAGAIYPTGTTVPLQSPDLISQYGERVSHDQIGDYRRGEGRNIIPARMSDDQAYVMANYYKLFKEFLDAGSAWVNSHPGTTTLDYMDSPDSASWAPYLQAMDSTLGTWVDVQARPVREADPGRPITVGYSNTVFAKMPSNARLNFQSVHRFTSHGYSGLNATFLVLNNIQRSFPGSPVMLEEFGYPGQVWSQGSGLKGYDPRSTANLESAVWAFLYSKGFAGGGKWMLNNFPEGDNPGENTYGLFDNNGQPKITAQSLRAISDLFSRSDPGNMSTVQPDDNYAVNYAYSASDALIAGGKVFTSTNVIFSANAPSQIVVGVQGGSVTLFATDVATTELNLPGIFGVPTTQMGRVSLLGTDSQGRPATPVLPTLTGDWLSVNLQPLYSYTLSIVPKAIDPAEPQPDPQTVYFPQTGHNLGGEFLKYWQSHGGLAIFGYPISEPFTERGYTVQYFERNRFELHPENQPPYNVLLGRLGVDIAADRTFPAAQPFQPTKDHRYFPETGHSLNFAFLGYWNANGGLVQFGYPISDEIQEVNPTDGKTYTVQYLERARFEYHPEFKGTSNQVLLGLLGVNTLKNRGWLP